MDAKFKANPFPTRCNAGTNVPILYGAAATLRGACNRPRSVPKFTVPPAAIAVITTSSPSSRKMRSLPSR